MPLVRHQVRHRGLDRGSGLRSVDCNFPEYGPITLKCKVKKSYEVKNRYLLRAGACIQKSAYGDKLHLLHAQNSASHCIQNSRRWCSYIPVSHKRSLCISSEIFGVSVIGREVAHTRVCVLQVAREGRAQVRQAPSLEFGGTKVAVMTFGKLHYLHAYNLNVRIISYLL
jgi:hypothetical protein